MVSLYVLLICHNPYFKRFLRSYISLLGYLIFPVQGNPIMCKPYITTADSSAMAKQGRLSSPHRKIVSFFKPKSSPKVSRVYSVSPLQPC
jgi:hypothetical protein